MFRYIIKRIIIFIPTLIIITLLGFIISINAPGDPVERMVSSAQTGTDPGTQSLSQVHDKMFWRKKLGLDLPVFYFSISSLSRPDTLFRIYDKNEREALDRLIADHGNWNEISNYSHALNTFYNSLITFSPDTSVTKNFDKNKLTEDLNLIKFESLALRSSYDETIIRSKVQTINRILDAYDFLKLYRATFADAISKYEQLLNTESKWKNYIPRIAFYKTANQYHRWLFGDGEFSKGLIRLDFGTSYTTKQPISEVIFSKIGWSMFFALLSVVLAYFISIPIGVKAAAKRGSRFDKTSSVVLFMLYSMPSFWLATLLLMTFANPDMFHWFPASGVRPPAGYPENSGLFEKIRLSLPYLILPAICYTYSSFAFLSRTMRVSMIETIGQDYIRTARAKGLPENKVIWKHAFRNSLLPIITVFANIFPAAIGGSVIIESIFTIPGMGYETFLGIQSNNYPMIIAVFTITGFLTLVGYLISDILYAIADPRISYK